MKILTWNCKRAAKPSFANYAKMLLRIEYPDIVCFLETHLSNDAYQRINRFLGQRWSIYLILAVGLSGGIVIAWHKGIGDISFMHVNRQMALGVISTHNEPTWILGVVYASTSYIKQCNLWDQVQL